jgi:hypothetical protein
MPPREHDET